MDVLGLDLAQSLIVYGARFGNQVAALPSLHAGWSTIIAWFLAERSPRWAWPLLAAYPLWMGFSLVVAGEHYVVDVLIGYLYAGVVAYGWRLLERRRSVEELVFDMRDAAGMSDPADDPVAPSLELTTG